MVRLQHDVLILQNERSFTTEFLENNGFIKR